MQTREEVEDFHKYLEFSQTLISGNANTGKQFSIAFIK